MLYSFVDLVCLFSNGSSFITSLCAIVWLTITKQYIRSKSLFISAQAANLFLQACCLATTLAMINNGEDGRLQFAVVALDQLTLIAVVVEIFILAWINVNILEVFAVIPHRLVKIWQHLSDEESKNRLLACFKAYLVIALSASIIAVTVFGILTCVRYPASPLSTQGQLIWKTLLLIGSAGCAVTDNFLAQYVAFIIFRWNRFKSEKCQVARQYYKLVIFNLIISFGDYIAVTLLFVNFFLWDENVSIKMGLFSQVGFHSTAAVIVFLGLKRLTFVGSPNDLDDAERKGKQEDQLTTVPRFLQSDEVAASVDGAFTASFTNLDLDHLPLERHDDDLPIFSIAFPHRAAMIDRAIMQDQHANILISPIGGRWSRTNSSRSRPISIANLPDLLRSPSPMEPQPIASFSADEFDAISPFL